MSKARDIASAAPAPSTVSATELGYLDGVTSAVQTQINSKEATLPSQTGNSGKYLTTDGSAKSWGAISSGSAVRTPGNSTTTARTATFSFVTGLYNVNITGPVLNFTVGSKIIESTGVYSLPSAASATINYDNTWIVRDFKGGSIPINSIAYGNGLFVVNSNVTNRVHTSPDGITWTTRTTGNVPIRSVTFGGGIFLAPGSDGAIQTSTDGITWSTRAMGGGSSYPFGGYDFYASVYGTIYVIGGASGALHTSTNGITWTSRPNVLGNNNVLGFAYGNSTYVVAGYAGKLMTSTDGISWTSRNAGFGTISTIGAVTYGNGLFVAVGDGGRVSTSTDGATWTTRSSTTTDNLRTVIYGNSVYAVGGDNGRYITSTDAITWTTRSANFGNTSIATLFYGNNLFIAGGDYNRITTSQSGTINTADDSLVSWNINSEITAV
jgi:hypothetical protein